MENNEGEVNNALQGIHFPLDTEITVCNICGESHHTESCNLLKDLKPVNDTPTISRARLTLPSGLKVLSLADSSTTVIACERFDRGTHFGPFQAPLTTDLHPGVSLPLKIFGRMGNNGYYLDTTNEETCNWMCLVAQASVATEQNLICYDMKQSIYFTTIKDILPGEELKVWYALYYGLKLHALPLPVVDESDSEARITSRKNILESKLKIRTTVTQEIGRDLVESLAQHMAAHTLGARIAKDSWQCQFCEKQECNVALYAKHLMSHYRPKCNLCNRRFYSEKSLLKHCKDVHAGLGGDTQHQNSRILVGKRRADRKKSTESGKESVESGDEEPAEIKSNDEGIRDPISLSTEGIDLKDYGDLSPLIPEDKDSQEVININNLNRSEIPVPVVETQLVLADDGSVVYHVPVPNPPKGVSSADMDKLGLLVLDDGNCPKIGEIAQSAWTAQASDPTALNSEISGTGSEDTTQINIELGTGGMEPYCIGKVQLENTDSVALIVLNTQENESPVQQLDNLGTEFDDEKMDGSTSRLEMKTCRKSSSFVCDICSKEFEKSAYLYRHLRKHTGEFTCATCLTVFARKENLLSHPCSHPMVFYPCHVCGKKFSMKKYLQRHIPLHSVPDKNKTISSKTQATRKPRRIKTSKVLADKEPPNLSVSLQTSGKTCEIADVSLSKAKNDKDLGKDKEKSFICEICGSIFKSFSSLKTHGYVHGERRFECELCGKRFHRKDVLQEHESVHQRPQLPCSQCGKKFKTKKSLEVHMLIHVGEKRFTCNDCGKEFYQKGNLVKHQRVHTPVEDRTFACQHCNKSFTSQEYLSMHTLEHTQGKIFHCTNCSKSFVKQHLLDSHQLTSHSNRAFVCRYCNSLMRHRHSARRHLEQQHPDKLSEWSQQGFVDLMLAQIPEDSLLLNQGAILPGQQDIRQEQLRALRRQHFGLNLAAKTDAEEEAISTTNQPSENLTVTTENTEISAKNGNLPENPVLTTAELENFTEQQGELLSEPLINISQLQLNERNVIPVPLEVKTQEEILVNVVEPHLQQTDAVYQSDTETILSINTSDTSLSKGEGAQVTIGGNTYILQDQVVFEESEMTSGDILLYVLDSGTQHDSTF